MSVVATNTLTSFRLALQAYLKTTFSFEFESGQLEGPIEDRTVGCCWTVSVSEWPEDVQLEQITVGVRIFKQWQQQQGLPNPSISDLEDLAETLQEALKPVQTTLGSAWQFRLTQVELDLETNGIEGTIVALQPNPFNRGG
jgi:hypothetical protein